MGIFLEKRGKRATVIDRAQLVESENIELRNCDFNSRGLTGKIWPPACLSIKFYWNRAVPFVQILPVAAFCTKM
jgi:hypothetical protein